MEPGLTLVIATLVVILIFITWFIATYNRFVRTAQHLRDAWSDIDVELKRRHDLIPNLVRVAKGYAAHEKDVLERVIELRNRAATYHDSHAQQASDDSALMQEVGRLFAVVEKYPDLKADAHFVALQQELANTEDRIAAARRFYNGNVRDLRVLCESFPSTIIASIFDFTPEEYYELPSEAERVVPRIQLAHATTTSTTTAAFNDDNE